MARAPRTERSIPIPQRTRAASTAATFDDFELQGELHSAISDAGFSTPRPIQAQAIPPALAGRDVLGLAQTGTGKTAAFVLPILQRLLGRRGKGPRVLTVAPTRELAAQVHAEFERLAEYTPLTATCVFGGVPIARQQRALNARPDVIVACPGRLLDLMNRGSVRLDHVEVLVLDEADHMFDMGFLPDIRKILRALPQRRQNLMFSATMPKEVRGLADAVLRDPVRVELANSRPTETIDHALMDLDEGRKLGVLEHILAGEDFRSAIVFLRTKHRARRLARRLEEHGHRAVALQGNMSQGQRVRAMAAFKGGDVDVLVATDIAARGLDIEGVSHVVNYDVPTTPDAYTHRIGRTGRAERSGTALTFVTPADHDLVRQIERRIGTRIERERAPKVDRAEALTGGRGGGRPRSQRGGQGGAPRGPGSKTKRGKAKARRRTAATSGDSTRREEARRPEAARPSVPFGAKIRDGR